ncbi:MAG TPA: hypothetical protein PLI27_00835 [Ignavibacteriales bacterium]|nr:hypothetical protein [Ignavibacteriales bacterium]HPD66609.1 hypothetical protein [Ignavibacteriales bacterium]HPP32420.1 hypothetical protein [Ignavibacteriales bacterium]HRR17611.1 hypothetical protein [Ignavibacteriales bacterium]
MIACDVYWLGFIYRSTHYGLSGDTITGYIYPYCLGIDKKNNIYAGTLYGLYVSKDDGKTWLKDTSFLSVTINSMIDDSTGDIYCTTGYGFNVNGDGVIHYSPATKTYKKIGFNDKHVFSIAKNKQM